MAEYCTQSSDIPPLHHTIVGYILGICLETGGKFIHDFKAREIPFGDTSKLPLYHRSVDYTSIFSQFVYIGIHKNEHVAIVYVKRLQNSFNSVPW